MASSSVEPSVAEAYAWCKGYTRARAKNFYYAFAVLPSRKRNAIYAAYAFSGLVDDIADESPDRTEQERELADARSALDACYAGRRSGALYVALGDAIDRFAIRRELFEELANGVEMDFTLNRYASWADLHLYCYRVASMIGLICTSIFGTKDDVHAANYAVDLGIALQIVNIMRDVREDAGRGRVYFPTDELSAHGLSAEDILACHYDVRFADLMRAMGGRAHVYFESGRRLLRLLDLRSRMCVNVMQGMYAGLLDRIEARQYNVLSGRIGLSDAEKAAAITRLWIQAARPLRR